ncbi:hypothetical protein F4803DRAFT_573064 [Xylaria telfairii]|nr:hypothetical protein F4803DRAFT_573064 [Xylaria telfairii]
MSAPLSPEQIEYYERHKNDSLQSNLIASSVADLVLSYTFVGLRIYARKTEKTMFSYDDWLIIAALAPLSTYAILGFIQPTFGEGKHIIFVTNIPGFIQSEVASIVAYAVCVTLTKLSILCFYCRIFQPLKWLRGIAWGFGIFIVAYNMGVVFVAAFMCIPLSSLWTGAPGKCIDLLLALTILGIINVVTDFAILALPIRPVLLLRLPLTRRIQLCCIFLLGAVVCVFGLVRVVVMAVAPPGDQSYNQVWSGIWSGCEISVGIVAACLPTLAVLATRSHLSRVLSSVTHLLSLTVRRPHGSNTTTTRGSGRSARETYSDENQFVQLSELSLVNETSRGSKRPVHQNDDPVPSSMAGSRIERGEIWAEDTYGS